MCRWRRVSLHASVKAKQGNQYHAETTSSLGVHHPTAVSPNYGRHKYTTQYKHVRFNQGRATVRRWAIPLLTVVAAVLVANGSWTWRPGENSNTTADPKTSALTHLYSGCPFDGRFYRPRRLAAEGLMGSHPFLGGGPPRSRNVWIAAAFTLHALIRPAQTPRSDEVTPCLRQDQP